LASAPVYENVDTGEPAATAGRLISLHDPLAPLTPGAGGASLSFQRPPCGSLVWVWRRNPISNIKPLATLALITALGISGIALCALSMDKVAAGERSSIASTSTVIVRDEVAWQALWNEARIRSPIPKIDFTKRMIVGIFLGTRPTSGFSVQVVEVVSEQEVLVVKYSERRPSPRAMVMQVLTAPFAIVSVPAHAGSVRFEPVMVSPPGTIR
jgi:hypothetical protein